MPLLPATYHHDVIMGVFGKKDPISLRNLILSSREMSHSFGFFMQKVAVTYGGELLVFSVPGQHHIEVPRVNIDSCYWTTHFIRKLLIRVDPSSPEEYLFFDKIYRRNNLEKLGLYWVASVSSEIVRNLISITRRLTMNANMLDEISYLLPRFDALKITSFGSDNDESKMFQADMESSSVLHVLSDVDPLRKIGIIYRNKQKFRHMNMVYIVWDVRGSSMRDTLGMLSDFWSNFPHFKKVNLYFQCSYLEDVVTLKQIYDLVKTNLGVVPQGIEVKMYLRTMLEEPNWRIEELFPAEDFVIKTYKQCSKFSNRHKKLSDNAEFSFEVFNGHR